MLFYGLVAVTDHRKDENPGAEVAATAAASPASDLFWSCHPPFGSKPYPGKSLPQKRFIFQADRVHVAPETIPEESRPVPVEIASFMRKYAVVDAIDFHRDQHAVSRQGATLAP